MEILYKDKNLVAVLKPIGVASQSDPSGDKDAMELCSEQLLLLGERSADLYPVHRLDKVVGGILVFARSKRYAAMLSELFSTRSAEKEYLAVVEGEAEGGALEDLLFKDSRSAKAFVVDRKRAGVKEARLTYEPLSKACVGERTVTLVRVKLDTGRFHQIRAQFSSRKMPILGDGKYGSRDNQSKSPALFASGLKFELDGKVYEFSKMPDREIYPWSLFKYD